MVVTHTYHLAVHADLTLRSAPPARTSTGRSRDYRRILPQQVQTPDGLARLDLSGKFIGNKASFVIFNFRKCRGKYAYPSQKVALAPREISPGDAREPLVLPSSLRLGRPFAQRARAVALRAWRSGAPASRLRSRPSSS